MSQADAWAAGASSSFTLLDFELQYSPAHEDEIIHVVGEDGALGCWNPINSVELVRAEGGEALWRPRAPVSVPSGAPVEYKYIVFRSGRLHRWEAFDGNRIVVPEGDHQAARRDVMDVLPPPRPASASAAALASMHIAGATAAAAPLPPVQDTSEQSAGDDDDVYAQAPTPAAMPRAASSTASELASTVGGAVLVVSYILPLSIQRAEGGGWAVEWNYDAVTAKKAESLTARKRVVWIGCPGIATEEDERESLAEKLQEFDSVPVFLEPEMQRTFYFGFCRAFLWPTLHNVIKDRRFSQKVWRAYCWVNKKFADKVIEVFEPSDHVWVHDYHLLLLPTSLLRKLHTPRVGLFLHTPFPSSEIFRTISVRDELLRGMLNCDLIGFHLFEYARHFLTCCKRMLGLEYTDFAQVFDPIPPPHAHLARPPRLPPASHLSAPALITPASGHCGQHRPPAPPARPPPTHPDPTSSARRAAASSACATASAPSSCRCRTSGSSPTSSAAPRAWPRRCRSRRRCRAARRRRTCTRCRTQRRT